MMLALFCFFPLLLVGGAAAAGFGTAFLVLQGKWEEYDREAHLTLALGLAIAIPLISAVSVLLAGSTEVFRIYGGFLDQLFYWVAGAFAIGFLFGGLFSWREKSE